MDYIKNFKLNQYAGMSLEERINRYETDISHDPKQGYWRYRLGAELYRTGEYKAFLEEDDKELPLCLIAFFSVASPQMYAEKAKAEGKKGIKRKWKYIRGIKKLLRMFPFGRIDTIVCQELNDVDGCMACSLPSLVLSEREEKNVINGLMQIAAKYMQCPVIDLFDIDGAGFRIKINENGKPEAFRLMEGLC